jgi:hypothetical protein
MTVPAAPAAPAASAPGGAPAAPAPAASAPGGAPSLPTNSGPVREYNNYIVGKINYTAKQLFEITGFVDLSKRFPDASAFVTFIPGISDNTKQTGITYNQQAKEIMKIGIRDLFALGEAIDMAAKGFVPADFTVFTDSSKFEGNTGVGVTKQISIGAGEYRGKPRIYINYKGTSQIQLSLDKWHAIGVAKQILNLADSTLQAKYKKEKEQYEAHTSAS